MSGRPATHREIPFNYTSADDRAAVVHLLGAPVWEQLEALRSRRVTGRSARLLMRVVGEVFLHGRNAYLHEELASSPSRRRRFFASVDADLATVASHADGDPLVGEVVAAVRALLDAVRRELAEVPAERARMLAAFGPIVGAENVRTDPFTLVAHATDATDWRLHLPVAVVTPTAEAQVAPLLAAIERLGLKAIPRGAGTGLTGGAVPLAPRCVVVNTERLDRILAIEERDLPQPGGRVARTWVMRLEAGVITEHAMAAAAERGLVFATDPTSAWACTIGGNIAENAGGKTAVLWGTCIDNLLAYSIAMPGGARFTVRRIDHRLRKILPEDPVTWDVCDEAGALVRTVALTGADLRRKGLWKDVTNKALSGLPGVQKEGTDGVITSAEFVLYRAYESSRTLCLEFFGQDLDEASRAILDVVRAFPDEGREVLQALEHFDDEYVRAIGYRTKAARGGVPKAVLLVDVVGHAAEETARGVDRIRALLRRHGNTFLFEARDAAEAKRFWADRKKLGAIAARTNAFKLNEDVVLPLEALAEFARFCDAANASEERASQRAFAWRARGLLEAAREEDGEFLREKLARARLRCDEALAALDAASPAELRAVAVAEALRRDLADLLSGYARVAHGIDALFLEERRRRIVLATHMHAGDGNVHVNIPVLSNDREMMRRAEAAVDAVMAEVARLGGVPSGEHGIGITKLQYLDPARVAELAAYRREVDPRGTMNPGKLEDLAILERVFTPSFNLLELEARILRHGKLEELATRIAGCVRCGKCKPDCCVFHPGRGMFYHPRNKNLAVGALVEALLYEAQRERGASFELLRHLEEVADHCTLCHKCEKPCPVDIDTAEVSVLEREILMAHGYKHHAAPTRATLRYLESTSPAFNAAFRAGVVRLGGALQRALAKVVGSPGGGADAPYPLQLLQSPGPAAESRELFDELPPCGPGEALVLEPDGEAKATVFYFPGCGSERLYGSVGMAALHVLLETGTRVVLPPPYLCCGFPAHANARTEQHGRMVLRDTIVFSQIREMFRHLAFDAVIVTCGTCREALGAMDAAGIFGCGVEDLARFAAERGAASTPFALSVGREGGRGRSAADGAAWLYHAPCHDSLDGGGPAVLARLGFAAEAVPHCCSEAGTLALSRPDITDAMLHRKRAALGEAVAARGDAAVVLTNCPSCLSGLGRNADLAPPRHVAVALAEAISGEGWREALRARARGAQAVRF
jgi:FAD/FMN-containing dehydrogenase/Fe-S oxidoreductase